MMRQNKRLSQSRQIWYLGVLLFSLLIMGSNCIHVKAKEMVAKKELLYQDHHKGSYDDDYYIVYYDLYPNDDFKNYKKFMKFTYVISDDSVIGLRFNGDVDFDHWIYDIDENGNQREIPPNDVKVHALGPGTATLKVYDGKKLVDSYVFTVKADEVYSPSSFVNTIEESYNGKVDTLIKQFTLAGAKEKYQTTNQRILAALNATIAHGGKVISEEKFQKLYRKNDDNFKYESVYWRLFKKNATAKAYAVVNQAVLYNLGLVCSADESGNEIDLRDASGINYIWVSATNKLKSDYDFTKEEESIYSKTHLPAWIINQDTKQQIISVGQTISLSKSDMNTNIYSSDSSVVTVQNGKITGVNPGIAIVYRYNDTYCDVFYVVVKKKGSPKTIQGKVYHNKVKTYFKNTDFAPHILGGHQESNIMLDWCSLRIYELEPIFGHGGSLTTKYSKGKLKCYLNQDGKAKLLHTTGAAKNAY